MAENKIIQSTSSEQAMVETMETSYQKCPLSELDGDDGLETKIRRVTLADEYFSDSLSDCKDGKKGASGQTDGQIDDDGVWPKGGKLAEKHWRIRNFERIYRETMDFVRPRIEAGKIEELVDKCKNGKGPVAELLRCRARLGAGASASRVLDEWIDGDRWENFSDKSCYYSNNQPTVEK